MESTLTRGVETYLRGLQLDSYIPEFEKHKVNMELFLSMDEEDLQTAGIKDQNDINLLLKYRKKFQRSTQDELTKSHEFEDIDMGTSNIAEQILRLNIGTRYIQENFNSKMVDFMVEHTSASLIIEKLCDSIEKETCDFISEIDELIQGDEAKKLSQRSALSNGTAVSVSIVTCIATIAVFCYCILT